ncbi:transcriptional regulator WhiB [Streptomyces spinoverrucosus]|uniref:Transcriptional regulator WhiB n=2 Tax=Streptomyces spinoverrucosus TaxID=284043 RepID=A0A4Y3VBI7_9ACTN|nr:transcriptional regulator WhiB [Streptomyces spinoverrucosus]GHB39642.1 transcriptional regulator WhiB [Streptomyces spinoverrucosus]
MHRFARGTRARMEWLRRAACVGEDPELFFPVGTTGPALRDIAAAKRVCARCSVITQCLRYALSSGQTSGVWGGTGEHERAALLRTARTHQGRGTT